MSGLTQDMLERGKGGSCQVGQDPTSQRGRVRGVPRRSELHSLLRHQPWKRLGQAREPPSRRTEPDTKDRGTHLLPPPLPPQEPDGRESKDWTSPTVCWKSLVLFNMDPCGDVSTLCVWGAPVLVPGLRSRSLSSSSGSSFFVVRTGMHWHFAVISVPSHSPCSPGRISGKGIGFRSRFSVSARRIHQSLVSSLFYFFYCENDVDRLRVECELADEASSNKPV